MLSGIIKLFSCRDWERLLSLSLFPPPPPLPRHIRPLTDGIISVHPITSTVNNVTDKLQRTAHRRAIISPAYKCRPRLIWALVMGIITSMMKVPATKCACLSQFGSNPLRASSPGNESQVFVIAKDKDSNGSSSDCSDSVSQSKNIALGFRTVHMKRSKFYSRFSLLSSVVPFRRISRIKLFA